MNNYDRINVPKFEEGKNAGYLCSMCGQYTTKSESCSHIGWNLLCNHCKWKIEAIIGMNNIIECVQEIGRRRESEECKKNEN